MQRISLTWVIETFRAIDALESVREGNSLWVSTSTLYTAKNQIDVLFQQSVYSSHLRVSREKALALADVIAGLVGQVSPQDRVLNSFEAFQIANSRNEFITVFKSELSTLPSFLVMEKQAFDLNTLIDFGERLFPVSMATKVPEAIVDANQAAKALAFELGTACGFHVFRVVEAVLKRYWDVVSGGSDRPKPQSLGRMASELEAQKHGEKRTWEALKQMAELHRNPLIHPEAILTIEEAIGIIGMARSVITIMLNSIPDALPTTVTAPTTAPA